MLIRRGLLDCEECRNAHGGDDPRAYTMNWPRLKEYFETQLGRAPELLPSRPLRGLPVPSYSSIEAALLDLVASGGQALWPHSLFGALCWHAERGIRWGKPAHSSSMSHMTNGVHQRRAKGDRWIRPGSGLSRRANHHANRLLRDDCRLLVSERCFTAKGGHSATEYTVAWSECKRLFEASRRFCDRLPHPYAAGKHD